MTKSALGGIRLVQAEHPDVQAVALLQRRAQGPVQAVLEVQVTFPLHRVREEVAVERRVLVQQPVQLQLALGGDQLVQPDLPRWQLGPVPGGQPVVRVRPAVAHRLEDHVAPSSIARAPVAGQERNRPTGPRVTGGTRSVPSRPGPGKLALDDAECQEVAVNLEERKLEVLRAVIEDYIATEEPVGSKALAERHHLAVSPATIRNDMALLEEEGYIAQPHTSAGRVPTDKG